MNEHPNGGATAGRSDEPDRLESWKEIAGYLNRDVRTVQRWERTEGLPVQRHRHGERGSVFALRSEIAAWRNARETPPPGDDDRLPWRLRPIVVSGIAALAALVVIAVLLGTDGGNLEPSPIGAGAAADVPRLLDALTRDGAQVSRVTTIPGGWALALGSEDRELYVGSDTAGLAVIDTASLQVVHRFETGPVTSVIASRGGGTVYVGQSPGDVLVIDSRTRAVRHIVTSGQIRGLGLSSDDRTLYVAASYAGLFAADTSTGIVRQLSALPCPMALAPSSDGRRLYVNYQCNGPGGRAGHDAIDVIDTSTGESVGVISGLANVGGDIVVSPDGAHIWADGRDACVTVSYDHTGCPSVPAGIINVVRTSDRTLLRSIDIPLGTQDSALLLRFTGEGSRVAVAYRSGVQVYNAATLVSVERAELETRGRPVFSRDGRTMYIPAGGDGVIAAVPIERRPAPPRGLRARWTADGTANDVETLSHGAIEGAVRYAPGYVGQAFLLDGRGGAIRIDHPGNMGLTTHSSFTLAFWMNSALSSTGGVLAELLSSGESPSGWRLAITADARLAACFSDGLASCDAVAPQRTTRGRTPIGAGWHHVALTWDVMTARLYVDGRLDGERALPRFVASDRAPFRLGGVRPSFAGRLDEIEMYERALSADEIAARARLR